MDFHGFGGGYRNLQQQFVQYCMFEAISWLCEKTIAAPVSTQFAERCKIIFT